MTTYGSLHEASSNAATCREAVGIFADAKNMETAIDELLLKGFARREISLLAGRKAAEGKLGLTHMSAPELADDPDAPRTDYFCPEALGGAEGALVGGFTYLPATGAFWIASSVAGTTVAATVATVASGGIGLLVGTGLAVWLARRHSAHIQSQLEDGGLIVWVRTRTEALEASASEVLECCGAHHVHIHDIADHSVTEVGATG